MYWGAGGWGACWRTGRACQMGPVLVFTRHPALRCCLQDTFQQLDPAGVHRCLHGKRLHWMGDSYLRELFFSTVNLLRDRGGKKIPPEMRPGLGSFNQSYPDHLLKNCGEEVCAGQQEKGVGAPRLGRRGFDLCAHANS